MISFVRVNDREDRLNQLTMIHMNEKNIGDEPGNNSYMSRMDNFQRICVKLNTFMFLRSLVMDSE